ncbi:MAG: metallophosphoesterase [Verrucomicrobia bacterium]|nr:metallophosphoesterase [Verrucomicrobiota bacterium]
MRWPKARACLHGLWLGGLVLAGGAGFEGIGTAVAAQVTIGILGDFGSAYAGGAYASNELAVANLIKSWQPDFIITTGDNNYPNGEAMNIDTNIGQFFHEFIYPYAGLFGAGASSNRFFPSIGNHDWSAGVSYLAPYLAYFTLPGNERYYSHRHGPVELFAVVSDQQEPDGATLTSAQALWLSNGLATSTAPWRVVYFHACPYSSGALHGYQTHQCDNMLWPFTAWGPAAIFVGHNHLYERVWTNGLNYTTIGLGGDRIDSFYSIPTAGSVARYNATYGAGKLVVTETNFVFQFINIFNQVIDSYTLLANPAQLALRWTGGQPQINWCGGPGRTYIIEASVNLADWVPVSTTGRAYIIEASMNLVDWVPVSTNSSPLGCTNILDSTFVGQPARFYRAVNGR